MPLVYLAAIAGLAWLVGSQRRPGEVRDYADRLAQQINETQGAVMQARSADRPSLPTFQQWENWYHAWLAWYSEHVDDILDEPQNWATIEQEDREHHDWRAALAAEGVVFARELPAAPPAPAPSGPLDEIGTGGGLTNGLLLAGGLVAAGYVLARRGKGGET